jgi:predicted dehydrogenase
MKGVGRLQAAVVGAGLMGSWHAAASVRSGARLAVVVDRELARARRLAARHRGCRATTELDTALAESSVRVFHLCTPAATRVPLATRVLEEGRHLLVEKPMAPTAPATGVLQDLARSRGVLLCPVHQFLFQPGVRRAQHLCATIGPVRHLDAVTCSAGAEGRSAEDQDAILPHPLSLFAALTGVPLADLEWRLVHRLPGELRGVGSAAQVSLGILVSVHGRPTRNTLRIIGERGTVHVDLYHGFAVLESGTASRFRKVMRPLSLSARTLVSSGLNLLARTWRWEPAFPGLRELVRCFYRAIAEGGEAPISSSEALAVAAARDAMLRQM